MKARRCLTNFCLLNCYALHFKFFHGGNGVLLFDVVLSGYVTGV
jgi:hypothetical protein